MKIYMARMKWTLAAIICLGVVACVGRHSAMPQFFMIDPVAPTSTGQTHVTNRPAVLISLDPVEIPVYLDRTQIVTRLNGTEYHLDEFNQWLEPLDYTLTRVISENLTEMLGDDRVGVLSMDRPMETDFSLSVQILRLEGRSGEEVILIARWSLFDQTENALSLTKRSVFREAVDGDGYPHLVAVQNRLIESLSREIADGIRLIVLQSGS